MNKVCNVVQTGFVLMATVNQFKGRLGDSIFCLLWVLVIELVIKKRGSD